MLSASVIGYQFENCILIGKGKKKRTLIFVAVWKCPVHNFTIGIIVSIEGSYLIKSVSIYLSH